MLSVVWYVDEQTICFWLCSYYLVSVQCYIGFKRNNKRNEFGTWKHTWYFLQVLRCKCNAVSQLMAAMKSERRTRTVVRSHRRVRRIRTARRRHGGTWTKYHLFIHFMFYDVQYLTSRRSVRKRSNIELSTLSKTFTSRKTWIKSRHVIPNNLNFFSYVLCLSS